MASFTITLTIADGEEVTLSYEDGQLISSSPRGRKKSVSHLQNFVSADKTAAYVYDARQQQLVKVTKDIEGDVQYSAVDVTTGRPSQNALHRTVRIIADSLVEQLEIPAPVVASQPVVMAPSANNAHLDHKHSAPHHNSSHADALRALGMGSQQAREQAALIARQKPVFSQPETRLERDYRNLSADNLSAIEAQIEADYNKLQGRPETLDQYAASVKKAIELQQEELNRVNRAKHVAIPSGNSKSVADRFKDEFADVMPKLGA